MKVFKQVVNIVIDVVLVLLLFISTFAVISSINYKKYGFSSAFGISVQAVKTDSMSGTFEAGDLIICRTYKEGDPLEVGDIISFNDYKDGEDIVNTHRIVDITDGYITTKGDNVDENDSGKKAYNNVLAVYTNHKINKLGNFILFIKKPVGFVCCIVLPLLAYIVYQIIYLIKLYNEERTKEAVAMAAEGASDDVKAAIIREYLAKQQQAETEKKENN